MDPGDRVLAQLLQLTMRAMMNYVHDFSTRIVKGPGVKRFRYPFEFYITFISEQVSN